MIISSALDRAFCVGADLKERRGFDNDDLRRQRLVVKEAFAALLELACSRDRRRGRIRVGRWLRTGAVLRPDHRIGQRRLRTARGRAWPDSRRRWHPAAAAPDRAEQRGRSGADRTESRRRGGAADRACRPTRSRGRGSQQRTSARQGHRRQVPISLRAAKRALRQGLDVDLISGLEIESRAWEEAAFSADRVEGIEAFNTRRAPRWPSWRENG